MPLGHGQGALSQVVFEKEPVQEDQGYRRCKGPEASGFLCSQTARGWCVWEAVGQEGRSCDLTVAWETTGVFSLALCC